MRAVSLFFFLLVEESVSLPLLVQRNFTNNFRLKVLFSLKRVAFDSEECSVYTSLTLFEGKPCVTCADFPSTLNSEQSYVICFVVPNQKQLKALASKFGIEGELGELCKHPTMEEEVLKAMKEVATSSKFALLDKNSHVT